MTTDLDLNRNALKSWLNRLNGTAESISSTKLAKLKYNIAPQHQPTPNMVKVCSIDLIYFFKNHGPEFEVQELPEYNGLRLLVRRSQEVEHK
jgi:hypothetical protein